MEPSAAAAGMVDWCMAGALLITTMATIGAVLLLTGADLIDTVGGGMTEIGITAGVATMVAGATDLHTIAEEEDDDTSATEAPTSTVAETITTETVAERGTGTMTGVAETAAPTTTLAAAGVGAAIALGVGLDRVRPVTVAALTAESASTVETRAAMAAGANLVGEPTAAVVLRPAHLPSLSRAFRSMALQGVQRLGALPRPSLHPRDSNPSERESLLLPLPQWHRPLLPAITVSRHQLGWQLSPQLEPTLLLHPTARFQESHPQHLLPQPEFWAWTWPIWHPRPSRLFPRSMLYRDLPSLPSLLPFLCKRSSPISTISSNSRPRW
mmetsp:Transcript_14308/g.41143  ORF Transcript_14308/g.41143 Transcript_14308/m.41143 type:complete len:326 (-) Transcript_14308:303-1280(-)